METNKDLELIMVRDCCPYYEDKLYMYYIESEKKYIIKATNVLPKSEVNTILECSGRYAHWACEDFFCSYYNNIKHILYPNMPYKEEDFEKLKANNLKIYEDIEKKFAYIGNEKIRLDNCINAYKEEVRLGNAK